MVEQEVILWRFLASRWKYQPGSGRLACLSRICNLARCEPASSCAQWLVRWHCWSKGFQAQTERYSNFANIHSNAKAGLAIAPWQSEFGQATNDDRAIVSKEHIKSCCPGVAGAR